MFLVVAIAALLAGPAVAAEVAPVDELTIYTRPGCPHCAHAKEFLAELVVRHPGLTVVEHDVIADPAARAELARLAVASGVRQLGVPAIVLRGRLFVGFDRAETTGRELEAWLVHGARGGGDVTVPLLGQVSARELGLPAFSVVLGLIDGFNPCAMWVLLFLLSMLVNLKSRARMAWIGGTFVAVSGLVYLAFMAAWLNLFLWVGASRPLQVALGVLAVAVGAIHMKDVVALHRGPTLSIPAAARSGIYARVRRILMAEQLGTALVLAVTLAVMVNLVELLCSAGLPAVFTQILAGHHLPAWQHYGYLGLYVLAYMVDDAIMLTIAVVTLSKHKLQERGGRALKLVSGAALAGLGLVLIARPEWLTWR